jgi:LmbE family N-acetylglucosaminyl deacetylase
MDGSSLSIVAHEDDDLLFQNPDIAEWIAAGLPHRTVFVTAGEFNGLGSSSREEYAAQRQAGERAAYAQMAGVSDDWDRFAATIAGREVEFATLRNTGAAVELVFLGLPDGGDALHAGALANLFNDGGAEVPAIVADGSPVAGSSFDRAGLIGVLAALMDRFQPTVVRIQDPRPDPLLAEEHQDHVAAARFAAEAFETYTAGAGAAHAVLLPYHCYGIADLTANLSLVRAADKASVFATYAAFDPQAADRGWTTARYYRWPFGSVWAARDRAGDVWAFVVLNGQVQAWRQDGTELGWSGPEQLGGGPVAPQLSVVANADGRLEVFALRTDTGEVTTVFQTDPDLSFSGWVSLGSPDPAGAPGTSAPAAAVEGPDGTGSIRIFVRNPVGGLSTLVQSAPNSEFGEWEDLDGAQDLVSSPSAVANTDGRLEVFAATGTGIAHWFQPEPASPFRSNPDFPAGNTAGAPLAVRGADDLLRVFHRGPRDGTVLAVVQEEVNGGWSSDIADLGSPPGSGQLTAVPVPGLAGRLLVVARTDPLGMAFTSQDPDGTFPGEWTELPVTTLAVAAGVHSGGAGQRNARPTLLTLGLDGRLYSSTLASWRPDLRFAAWRRRGG